MIKRDPFAALLAAGLLLAVIATAGMCYWYIQCARQLTRLQWESSMVSRNRNLVQQLAVECMEYGKRNPAIVPVLNSAGIVSRPQPANAPQK